ncbi:hypothetical protein ACU82A_20695 [Bacillus cereus]
MGVITEDEFNAKKKAVTKYKMLKR